MVTEYINKTTNQKKKSLKEKFLTNTEVNVSKWSLLGRPEEDFKNKMHKDGGGANTTKFQDENVAKETQWKESVDLECGDFL